MPSGPNRELQSLVGEQTRIVNRPAHQPETVPAGSKATVVRSILRPAFSASSRQRLSSFSNALSSTASFFNG